MKIVELGCVVLVLALTACGTETTEDLGDEGTTSEPEIVCSELTAISCEDSLVQDLSLQESVSVGEVTNERLGAEFVSGVDATAGGFQQAASNPWLYVRFTDAGLEKVEISDEDSLESMEWHLAAHRFKIRLNGGSSGPSCIGAAAMLEETYDGLTEVPVGLEYYLDDYYTPDCSMIEDTFGMGSPQLYMSGWWEYPGCVATTGTPYFIQLEDGRVVKLVVEAYYESGQENCNANGSTGSGSANLQWRWRFM
ncbi:MAG: HmuY family protein [Myxococcota bacterium]|nr:HmuY family protein [Myxococcota bacterium]